MGWRTGEVWLDSELLWFRPPALAPAGGVALPELPRLGPAETGLDASRRRRLQAQSERRRRRATRTVPAVALVVGSASMLSVAALRGRSSENAVPLHVDPPSLTQPLDDFHFRLPEKEAAAESEPKPLQIEWHHAQSVGLQYAGSLVDGTQLPLEGPDWVTWNPNTNSVPNEPWRLYGNEHTIRRIISVLGAYRRQHPHAPKVVIGDISLRGGGPMDQHASHQNGLDVDVYYPRRDGVLREAATRSQIDFHRAQELLDLFVASGAKMVFVGYSTGLQGPSGVVIPYPSHETHMHVRYRAPLD